MPEHVSLYDLLEKVAPTKTNILIYRRKRNGKRIGWQKRFITTAEGQTLRDPHCGAIPESLIESELFNL